MGLAPEKASRINTHYDRTASVGLIPDLLFFQGNRSGIGGNIDQGFVSYAF